MPDGIVMRVSRVGTEKRSATRSSKEVIILLRVGPNMDLQAADRLPFAQAPKRDCVSEPIRPQDRRSDSCR